MDSWHATFLGLPHLPREITAFEREAFFQFSAAERRVIEGRRRTELKLGLALQIGFLRMSGWLLDAVRIVPPRLWRHLGEQFAVAAPDLASLRAMYRRAPTLIEHQQQACETLGFRWLTEHQRRALVSVLRGAIVRTDDRQRLLGFARRSLYEHRLLIVHERRLRTLISVARGQHEAELAMQIGRSIEPHLLERWRTALTGAHKSGCSLQSWLWAAPAKHSSRQIDEMIERIETFYELRAHEHLVEFPDDLLRRHARRRTSRPPSVGTQIREPVRSIESACFLRYGLLIATDRVLLMVRRRVAELWRTASVGADATLTDPARLYQGLLGELGALVSNPTLSSDVVREQLGTLLQAHRARRPRSRAEIVRERLIAGVRPVLTLLKALTRLPWRSSAPHPVVEAMRIFHDLYEHDLHRLPCPFAPQLGRVWQRALAGEDRERAFAAAEVATLLNVRRALRNGTVWIEHSRAFRSRERLFIATESWRSQRRAHYRRLTLPQEPAAFLEPLTERAEAALQAVATAAAAGELRIEAELHLSRPWPTRMTLSW